MIVNTVGPSGAKIFFVGEAPGKDEDAQGVPFVGRAGNTFNWMIGQAGINRNECLIGNIARVRPPGNKINYYFEDKGCTLPKPQLKYWIEELKKEIEFYKPNVVVALGATALWALTGEKRIGRYHGYVMESTLVPGVKVIPTYHPLAVNYEWKLHFITILELRKVKRHSEYPEIPEDNRVIVSNATPEQFISYCREAVNDKSGVFDRLTTDVETVQPGSHIATLGFSHSRDFAISINLLSTKSPMYNVYTEYEIWKAVDMVMRNKAMSLQNGAYDLVVFMLNHGIHCPNVWMDTLLAAHACFPELPRDLGYLGGMLLDVPAWKHLSKENRSLYNAFDCCNTFAIAEELDKQIDLLKVRDTFDVEMSQLPVVMMLQLQGMDIDAEKRKELINKHLNIATEMKKGLEDIIKKPINLNSPKQMQQLLYIDLGLPVQYKRRKSVNDARVMTSDANALKKLSRIAKDNPIFRLILEYKKSYKLLSFLGYDTKNDCFNDYFVSPEGKVHSNYNITGKKMDNKDEDDEGKKSFGRWSSSASIILPYGSGNLQNIPNEARKMYRTKPGYKLVQADLKQAEAVVVAYLCRDTKLINMFKESYGQPPEVIKQHPDWDIHKLKAASLFGILVEQVTGDQRKIGKTIRHARNYSAGPQVVADRVGCSLSEAKRLLQLDDIANPLLNAWHGQIRDELGKTRTLVTPLGRRHRFLDRWGDNLFRSAYSFIPQSTVGDLLNLSIVKLYNEYGDKIHIALQLHDAIYVICKEEEVIETTKILRKCMTHTIEVNHDLMTIDVDFKVGDSWGEQDDI